MMDTRFNVISEKDYSDMLYPDFPLILQKDRITYDKQENKVIIQMKFCNVSEKIVNTLYLKIECMDVTGNIIYVVDEYIMSMIAANHGQSFESKPPVLVEDTRIAKINILLKKVVFQTGEVWENTACSHGISVEPAKKIIFTDKILTQFYKEAPKLNLKVDNQFEEFGTYWRCSCGMLNSSGNTCKLCQAEIENLRKCFDEEYLTQRYEAEEVARKNEIYARAERLFTSTELSELEQAVAAYREVSGWREADAKAADAQYRIEKIKREQQRLEDERRRKLELERERAEKKARFIKLAMVIGSAAVIVFLILTWTVIIPENKYKKAVSLMTKRDYAGALEIFAELDGYKDSQTKSVTCKLEYEKAEREARLAKTKSEVKDAKEGDVITFGYYNSEPLKWTVLKKEDNKAFILCDDMIAERSFHDREQRKEDGKISWRDCSLRQWLNSTFYDDAFFSQEQQLICETEILLGDRKDYTTIDKIFLLDSWELERYSKYIFNRTGTMGGWWLRGVGYVDVDSDYKKELKERTESPFAFCDGWMGITEESVWELRYVRPALWIDISK